MRWPFSKQTSALEALDPHNGELPPTLWATQGSVFDAGASSVQQAIIWALGLLPEQVWNTQPYVRTVVTFLARNIAQLGLQAFDRVSDTERIRIQDDPLARTIRRPNPNTTTYELIFGLVADKALYDRAYWLVSPAQDGAKTLTRLPPARVVAHIADDPLGSIKAFRLQTIHGVPIDIPAERVLYFPGWNPTSAIGLPQSPIESIKSIISEQAAAFEFRQLAWANGLQTSQTISRPVGATWKPEQRDKFIEDVRSQFSGTGPRRNGVLLLEDGMQLTGEQFSAREAQWIDAAKLSLALVASVYHVNPTMVGLLDNANYSNVREFHRALYSDTLGPIIASIEDRLNSFLVPMFSDGNEYVEFNIAEKLQGSFEEQAAAMQTAVGAPWMLRSEARALVNLPPIDGADELVVPMNLITAGGGTPPGPAPSSSPTTGPPTSSVTARPLADVIELKRAVTDRQQTAVSDVLSRYFGKQQAVVLSRLGAGDEQWWDAQRWNDTLMHDLRAVALSLSSVVGRDETRRLGFDPDAYSVDQTQRFIEAVAQRYAENINSTTKQQLDDELAKPDGDPSHVYDVATSSRAAGIAVGYSTFAAGFGTHEAANQASQREGVKPSKTWLAGNNPRPSHAAMSGETVPIDQPFSNGMQWPAESGDVDEVAGCNCSIEISVG
jgi:HK97 family phage portal protein